jgi:hypothetical protein
LLRFYVPSKFSIQTKTGQDDSCPYSKHSILESEAGGWQAIVHIARPCVKRSENEYSRDFRFYKISVRKKNRKTAF